MASEPHFHCWSPIDETSSSSNKPISPKLLKKYPKILRNFSKNPHESPRNQILHFPPCQQASWVKRAPLVTECSSGALHSPPQSSSLIFSRSGTLVTATSRVEQLNQGREEGRRRKRKSKCEGFDSSEWIRGGERVAIPPRRWFAAWKWIYDAQDTQALLVVAKRKRGECSPRRRRMNTKDTPAGNGNRRNSAQIRLAFWKASGYRAGRNFLHSFDAFVDRLLSFVHRCHCSSKNYSRPYGG